MREANLYSGSQEPQPGGLIYADLIKALMRGQRDPQSTTTLAPVVIDDYIHIPLIISNEAWKIRHKLLKITSYDELTGAWFAGLPDDDDPDSNQAIRGIFVVYQEFDYGILIGDKPVRINVSPTISAQNKTLTPGDNIGPDDNQLGSLDRYGLIAITQVCTDDVGTPTEYCLVVRGAFDSRLVQATFIDYETEQDEADLIARCLVVETTVTGLIGQEIKVKDRDGGGFGDETAGALAGRLIGAVWMQYEEGGYYFWRWSLWKISCPP